MPTTMVYVARRKCGCVVAAIIDDADELGEERRKAISDCLRIWIRAGWRVDSMAAEEVPAQWFTVCPHTPRQPRLPSDSAVTVTDIETGERVSVPDSIFGQAAKGQ